MSPPSPRPQRSKRRHPGARRRHPHPGPTPVTIVTGALGAGKTTLVNAALPAVAPRRVGVIVNEFGDVGLDGYLIGDRPETTLELTSGCLCCSVRGELDGALAQLAGADIDHVLVETTGVADPGPVIESVARQAGSLNLDGVLTVVDARNLLDQLADPRRPEVARQVELASTVAVTKADLAGPGATIAVRERIVALNPLAEIHDAPHGRVGGDALLGARAFDPGRVALELHGRHDRHHDHDHDHDHHGVESISVGCDGALDLDRLAVWLQATLAFKGSDLNRVKGILAVDGEPNRVLVHGVGGYLEIGSGAPWEDEPPRCTLVAIGHELNSSLWERALQDCRAQAAIR